MEYRRIDGKLVKKTKEEWEALAPETTVEEQIAGLILELKALDYKTIKYTQDELTEEEFDIVKADCNALREQIRTLESS